MTTSYQHIKRKIRLVALILGSLLALGVIFPQSLAAQTGVMPPQEAAVFTISQPDGTGDKVAEGSEYSIDLLGDPWDMSAITDIYNEQTRGINSSAGTNRMAIENGQLVGTTTDGDGHFFLIYPGYELVDIPSLGRYGINYPIDTAKYTQLSVRMYLGSVGGDDRGQVLWFANSELNASEWGASQFFTLESGWRTYTINLAQPKVAGNREWTGLLQGLRLDPTTASGVEVKIDWVRLTGPDVANTTYDVQFGTGTGVGFLYSDTDTNWDNGHYSFIGGNLPLASTTNYSWGTINIDRGNYYVAGRSGIDYATLALDNPWDMADSKDVAITSPDVLNPTFSNGIFSFTTNPDLNNNSDPYFRLHWDSGKPIDADVFTQLTFRMNVSENVVWIPGWRLSNGDFIFFGDGTFALATPGWNTYTVDLSSDPKWTGDIQSLRIKPAQLGGVTVQIDWVSLSAGTQPTEEGDLAVSTTYSPGPLTVNTAPIITITQPSMTSGEDYASTELGNPWDMDSLGDTEGNNMTGVTVVNGVFSGASPADPTGDSQIYLHTGGLYTQTPINADKYKYLSYRYQEMGLNNQQIQDTVFGWVTRINWWKSGAGVDRFSTKDIVINEGWNTYQADLSQMKPELLNDATIGLPDSLWQGTKTVFRFDPNEITATTTINLDWVLLTAPDAADQSFEIKWVGSHATGAMVDLFYDTDRDPAVKSQIVLGVAASAGTYTWNTSGVAEGTYNIYIMARDGFDGVGRYSVTPVRVKRAPAAVYSEPLGNNDTVPVGSDYASNVRVDAWDMSEATDVSYTGSMTAPIFAGGVFSATSTTDSPEIRFAIDSETSIAAATFSVATFRLYANQEGQGQLLWFAEGSSSPGVADAFRVYKGWNEYRVDLSKYPAWAGKIYLFRLDPIRTAGVDFALDYMKLTTPNSASFNINWTTQNPDGAKVSLFYDTDNAGYDGVQIATDLAGTKTNFPWDLSHLDAGDYYVYAVMDNGINPKSRAYAGGRIAVAKPVALMGQPDGTGDSVVLGSDFASNALNDPWDMAQSTDLGANSYGPTQLTVSFADGIMSATSTGDDPSFWLANTDATPIDTTRYTKLVFRMWSDQPGQWQAIWTKGDGTAPGASPARNRRAGWAEYTLDLGALSGWTSMGTVRAIRIDPAIAAGINLKVDWVKLVAANSSTFAVQWTPQNAGSSTQALYYDTDAAGYDGSLIAAGISTAVGTYTWDTSFLDAGDYYVYSLVGAGVNQTQSYAPGAITVLKPSATLTQPDGTGDSILMGPEFSRDQLDNPWDMDSSDIGGNLGTTNHLGTPTFSGGIMRFTINGGDPWMYLNNKNGAASVDTTKNNRMSIRMNVSAASQLRVDWLDPSNGFHVGPVISTTPGWQTYVINLGASAEWTGSAKNIRILPATGSGTVVEIDWIKLYKTGSATYAIQWTPVNMGGNAVSIFYDTNNSGADGTLIANGVSGTASTYTWDASSVDPGIYYVYVQAGAGANTSTTYSPGPLTIRQPGVIFTAPDGVSDRFLPGTEFSASVLGNAWDMNGGDDVAAHNHLGSPIWVNGEMIFTTTGGDPYMRLNFAADRPANTALFNKLVVRMYSSKASQWTVLWQDTNSAYHTYPGFITQAGWNTYELDLTSSAEWTGQARLFHLKPAIEPGVTIHLDSVRLVKANAPSTNIQWQADSPSSTVALYYNTASSGNGGTLIATGLAGTVTNRTWDLSSLVPGRYYVYAKTGGGDNATITYAPGPVQIVSQTAPTFEVSPGSIARLTTPSTSITTHPIIVDNSGLDSYAWTASKSGGAWLTISPTGGSTQRATISVQINPTGLAPGTYNGSVTINAPGVGNTTIPVKLIVVNTLNTVMIPLLLR